MSASVSLSIATNTAIALSKGFGWFVTGSPTLFAVERACSHPIPPFKGIGREGPFTRG